MDRLPRGSVLLVAAAPVRFISGIVPVHYRQDSDFLYLTGENGTAIVPLCVVEETLVCLTGEFGTL